ncbi:MAG: MBL fold metallo-hydrolase [Promethearchaeota archaeon]
MSTEWTEGIFRILMNVGKGGEAHVSYVVIDEEIAVIDCTSSKTVVPEILSLIRSQRRKNDDVKHIILTHTHPDHIGGLVALKKQFPSAKLYVQENGAETLQNAKEVLFNQRFPLQGKFAKLSLALSTGMFADIKKIEPEHVFQTDETIDLGQETLMIQASGGHSNDHAIIHAVEKKATFIGDESFVYADKPESFFFDLTGDPARRNKTINLLKNMKTELVCPAHTPPIPCSGHNRADLVTFIDKCNAAYSLTERTIIDLLSDMGDSSVADISYYLNRSLDVNWKSPFAEMKVGSVTVEVILKHLKKEGRAEFNPKKNVWKTLDYSY